MNKSYFKCMSDPYEEYTGYDMTPESFFRLLKEGSLPPGSVWRERCSGLMFTIAGNEEYYRMAVVLDEVPRTIKREPQWLTR